jgi:ribosomal protein S18 acetylase RimI-like enzyme
MTFKLISADNFTIEQLTDAYNHTRVDYMVPMPMNVARLTEYIHLYDVDLSKSFVALADEDIVGLGMLAIRENRSWYTRLGVITNQRSRGIGQALTEGMICISDALKIEKNMLEVIVGNKPAHNLFLKLGFHEHSELMILRRAPAPVGNNNAKVYPMDKGDIYFSLKQRRGCQAWTNQTESLYHAKGIHGFHVYPSSGGHGWLVYQRTLFNLSRIMFETEGGDHEEIMMEMLKHLHREYPELDTYTENIPANDPRLPAFNKMGYFEVFRRIEMHRNHVI